MNKFKYHVNINHRKLVKDKFVIKFNMIKF